jgi:hypothetical protein
MLTPIREKTYQRAALLVTGFVLAVVMLTFQHYGVSWDEEIQSQYGQAVFDYYNSGFVDHRYNQIFNLYLYGGMFDALAAFVDAYSPLGIYATRHLLNALFGVLGLWGTWRLGRRLGGGQVGLVALILLALTPMYYGHMFNNPKDIPFACGVVWTLYYMTKSLRYFPRVSPRDVMMLSLCLGLTLGVRVGGVMLLGYWGAALVALAFPVFWEAKGGARTFGTTLWRLARLVVPVAVIACAIMLACWPWAQESPLKHTLMALIRFSNFPQNVEVLLNGTTYMSTELPWFYLPLYFGVQLPLPHLALILAGIVLLPLVWRDLTPRANRCALILLLLTAFVPVTYAVTAHPALYDAVRHFIFILPVLCILAALALRQLIKSGQAFLANRSLKTQHAITFCLMGLLVLLAALQIAAMVRLHPYEYIYANQLEGGVQGAYGKYELDYWGSSFKEAAERLQAHVAKEGGVPPGKIYRVAICGPWSSAMIYLPPDYEPVIANEPAEFFLSTTRWMCQNMRPGNEIIRVKRMGVPLSIIKDLRIPGTDQVLPGT